MPPGLPNKAIDHAEAKAGSFANLLGREEGFKNSLPHVRGHANAGVPDGQLDIRAGQTSGNCAFGEDDVSGLNLEETAVRHRVASIESQVEEGRLQLGRINMAEP